MKNLAGKNRKRRNFEGLKSITCLLTHSYDFENRVEWGRTGSGGFQTRSSGFQTRSGGFRTGSNAFQIHAGAIMFADFPPLTEHNRGHSTIQTCHGELKDSQRSEEEPIRASSQAVFSSVFTLLSLLFTSAISVFSVAGSCCFRMSQKTLPRPEPSFFGVFLDLPKNRDKLNVQPFDGRIVPSAKWDLVRGRRR
jgi:hypothetical protein